MKISEKRSYANENVYKYTYNGGAPSFIRRFKRKNLNNFRAGG